MNTSVHFSSNTDLWSTPQEFYDELNKEFNFELDPCATHENAKCALYYTKDDNGLEKSWRGMRVFMNPPYGREIGLWMKKAWFESTLGSTVVCLVPARTDTIWWHSFVIATGAEVRFVKGRLKFGGSKNSAPFPSAVVVFDEHRKRLNRGDKKAILEKLASWHTDLVMENVLSNALWGIEETITEEVIEKKKAAAIESALKDMLR